MDRGRSADPAGARVVSSAREDVSTSQLRGSAAPYYPDSLPPTAVRLGIVYGDPSVWIAAPMCQSYIRDRCPMPRSASPPFCI